MYPLLKIPEHHEGENRTLNDDDFKSVLIEAQYNKSFHHKSDLHCFSIYKKNQTLCIDAKYFIGVDWIVPQKAAIYVEPKLNQETIEVDFLGMLLNSLEATENLNHLDGLFHVDYDQPWITIPTKKDFLSPILIIQFLKLTQRIVRKGLKKSYYRVTENLNSKVKGKILVGEQIKENILKNRLTNTICNYQYYGINNPENQFLKLVIQFVSSWLSTNEYFLGSQLLSLLQYCQPAFEHVAILDNKHQKIHCKKNPFYKEYEEAIKIGEFILKRFSFNLTKNSNKQTETPPFWIDMSKLFELYVFQRLKVLFPAPEAITYHDSYLGGKETDILIRAADKQCVVDCKYKPQYKNISPSLEDKRQLAGYTRQKSVYDKLSIPHDRVIKGLIIYPHQNNNVLFEIDNLFKTSVDEYVDFYKLGISLPELPST